MNTLTPLKPPAAPPSPSGGAAVAAADDFDVPAARQPTPPAAMPPGPAAAAPLPLPRFARGPVLALVGAFTLLMVVTSAGFGYWGDELYFVEIGRHLAWGYVDQPPMQPLLAHLMNAIAPHSAVMLRLPGVLAASATVLVSALIARELGGGRRAQLLSAAVCAIAPGPLMNAHHLTTASMDLMFWTVSSWLVVRWVRTREDRLLWTMGAVSAVAFQDKFLISAFWGMTAAAMLAVGPRDGLRRRATWGGAAIVGISVIPGLLWQAHHHWPQAAMAKAIRAEVVQSGGRLTYLPTLFSATGLVGGVLLVAGAWWLLRAPEFARYRFFGVAVAAYAVVLLVTEGREYYLAGFFPVCWSAAAVRLEHHRMSKWWRWAPTWTTIVISSLIFVRAFVPLHHEWLGGYDRYALGLREPGWTQMTQTVSETYHQLPSAQQQTTAIVVDDYGWASGITWYASEYNLPTIYSGHRGFYYVDTPPATAQNVLYVGPVPDALSSRCTSVHELRTFVDPVAGNIPSKPAPVAISLCTGLKEGLPTLWPELLHY